VRKARRLLNLLVPAMGMALVIGAVLFGESLVVQLFLVVAGLLLTESGLWRLAEPLLPDERKYVALREETEHFTTLVRQLNTTALAVDSGDRTGPRFALDEVKRAMHQSVDRMAGFAGKTADEVPPEEAGPEGEASGSGGFSGQP
jgi:hypothetical protein